MDPLLMYLEHHREARHITAVLKTADSWMLLRAAAFPDQPLCMALDLVEEGEVFACHAAPREACVLQGRANLRLVESLKPLAIKQP